MPKEVEDIYSKKVNPTNNALRNSLSRPQEFDKSQAYSYDKFYFGLVQSTVSLLENSAIYILGGYLFVWNLSGDILLNYGYSGEITQSVVFTVLFMIWSTVTSLPFGYYHNFVLEEKHGMNKQV